MGLLHGDDEITLIQVDSTILEIKVAGEGATRLKTSSRKADGKTYLDVSVGLLMKVPAIARRIKGRFNMKRKSIGVHELIAMVANRAMLMGTVQRAVGVQHVDLNTGNNHRSNLWTQSREVHTRLHREFIDTDKAAYLAKLDAGMCPSEILGLQRQDVDLAGGSVMARRALTRNKGGRGLTPPKTTRSRRTIPLPATIAAQLREHQRAQQAEREAAGAAYNDQGCVFAGRLGQPLCDKTLTDLHFKPVLARAGLPRDIRFYDLRHTCATLLLLANVNPKIVSERLGHSTVTLTLDTYSHVLPTMQRATADQLEQMLFG